MTDLPDAVPEPGPHPRATAARSFRRGIDVLVAALAVVGVVAAWHRVGADDGPVWRALLATGLAVVLVAVYGWGSRRPAGGRTGAGAWLGVVGVVWLALLVAEPAALWLAFPLMFLELHVLPRRPGVAAVAATTVVSVVAALARGQQPAGSVLGPVLGALVATGVVLGLEAVARESAQRQRVIDELVRARAQAAAAERAEAVAVERERLAREIHDTLAQGFSSVELLLRAADAAAESGDAARVRELVASARAEAGRNLEEARRVVRALAPPDLDAATLVGALRRVAERTSATGEPRVRVEVSGTPQPVPVPVETALLRVAQSALANVVQHAEARQAVVTLTFLDGTPAEVALDVVDDGRGFDPGAAARADGGGFGLVAMRSRVVELGGTLVVEAAPGSGTAVSVRVPLAPDLTPAAGGDGGEGS
ncbi:sensor histidine kinase [Luteimicrobium sp. DT211]|uniref:sensor histidine kinase n=1 Tax=Luteimicrobium sp. DT211 TaxID=3393412 RepID=UPI003CF32D97